jgi:hypothetical protein
MRTAQDNGKGHVVLASAAVDAAPQPDPYVYAANDIRPRQAREIELCHQASSFDWMYTGTFALGTITGIYLNTQLLKQNGEPGVRLLGPAITGFAWGGFLSGGYLSLPKCDPLWAEGYPPEGDIRATAPLAISISVLATITAPAMDFIFLGQQKVEWHDWERASRVFVGMGAGLAGSIFPYIVSPRTWAARKEIDRIRIGEVAGGPFVSYGFAF